MFHKKDNAKKKTVGKIIGRLIILTILICIFLTLFIRQRVNEITLESGQKINYDVQSYFDGSELALSFLRLENRLNSYEKPGEYHLVYKYLGVVAFDIKILVSDTVAPKYHLITAHTGIAPGEKVFAASFVSDLYDAAGNEDITVSFLDGAQYKVYNQVGTKQEETIVVADASGNKGESTVTVTVAQPPVIEAPDVYYVQRNDVGYEACDFLSCVHAWDEIDGELPMSQVNVEVCEGIGKVSGSYVLRLWVRNFNEVKAEMEIPIEVCNEDQLTDELLSHPEALIKGEVITKDEGAQMKHFHQANMDLVKQQLSNGLVSIYYELPNGFAYGNGVVIDLTEDAIYVASNYHVLAQFQGEAKLTFANGEATNLYSFMGGDEMNDIAFLRIWKTDISEETVAFLKEPRISIARAKSLATGEELVRESLYVNKPMDCKEGELLAYDAEIFNGSHYTTFSVPMVQGDSGSGIYDAYGYLISICAGIDREQSKEIMCGVRLENVVREYERVTGNSLYAF